MVTFRRLFFFALLGVTVLVSAEATARFDDRIRHEISLTAVPDRERDLVLHDSLGARGRPHGRFDRYQLNNFGFRGDDIDARPRPGCTRIMVLGASESFGLYEGDGKEFPAQLHDSLARSGGLGGGGGNGGDGRGGICYEVVNAAMAGATLRSLTSMWNQWGSRFGSDVVLVYPTPAFYLSEYAPSYPAVGSQVDPAPSPWWIPRLIQKAKDVIETPDFIQRHRVARKVAAIDAAHSSDWFFRTVPEERLAQFVEDLDSLATTIHAHGARPILLTHAHRFPSPPTAEDSFLLDAWRQANPRAETEVILAFERAAAAATVELGRRRGIQVVDIAAAMTGERVWFTDFSHFTDTGAGVVAKLITTALLRKAKPAGDP